MSSVLNTFLSRSHEILKANTKNIVVVTGNEGGDMDSIVGAIFLAFFLNETNLLNLGAAVPVINFPFEDLPLRNDVYRMFQQYSIDFNRLISIQKEEDTPNYLDISQLDCSVVLYDHNKLMESQAFLGSRVVGVVDHHFDEQLYLETTKKLRTIRTVGSATTLVAELFKDAGITVPSPAILAAPIILDTTNFKEEQKKVTPADVAAYEWLKSSNAADPPFEDSHTVFKTLSAWKKDIFGLSIAQNFRRDYKQFNYESVALGSSMVTGISSVPCSYEQFVKTYNVEEIISASAEFVEHRKLHVLITAFAGKKDGAHTRDVCFFGPAKNVQIFEGFTTAESTGVTFTRTCDRADEKGNLFWSFSLSDPSVSRKRLAPALAKYLAEGHASSL